MFFKDWTKYNSFELVMITLGCSIYAFSLDLVSIPSGLADGGLSGITLIIRHFFHINLGISTLFLNIPLILIGLRYLGKRMMAYTIYGTICLSLFLIIWSQQALIQPLPLRNDYYCHHWLQGYYQGWELVWFFVITELLVVVILLLGLAREVLDFLREKEF